MDEFNEILKQQATHHEKNLYKQHQLLCKQLQFGNELPIYIAKQHWTNRFDSERESTIGIFFSIWVTPALLKKQQFNYNIHSKTLAKLPGYQLKPVTFAKAFRQSVNKKIKSWPNIRVDYGPATLLQGHDHCHPDTFAENVSARIADFVSIHNEIDDLLEAAAD